LGAGLLMTLMIWLVNREPVYQGRTMSEWFNRGLASPTNMEEFGPIFLKFGDPGCAYLARQLTSEVSKWKQKAVDWGNRFATLFGLRQFRRPEVGERRRLACRLLGYFGGRAAPRLVATLAEKSAENRLDAIRAMAELGPSAADEVGPVLIGLLKDPSEPIVYEAITSLGMVQYRPEVVLPLLVPLLQHSNTRMRVEASYAIGSYPPMPELTLQPLSGALGDSDSVVRGNSMRALSKMGKRAENALEAIGELLNGDSLPAARAVEAIASSAGRVPESIRDDYYSAHERVLAGKDQYFQLMVLRAHVWLGDSPERMSEVCRNLVWDSRNWHSLEAVEAVAELEPRPEWATLLLAQATNHPNGLVRAKAVAAGLPVRP
jgi:HEAT repeat protein